MDAVSADGVVFSLFPNDMRRRDADIHSLPHLAEFRKNLRKSLTPAEATFWKLVKNSKFERRKFVRQHSVGNYILDFYCPSEKLAIELDGAQHFSGLGAAKDRERTGYLESKGIRVLRFENREVFEETEWVLDMIRANFQFGPPATPTGYAPKTTHRKVIPGSAPYEGGVDATSADGVVLTSISTSEDSDRALLNTKTTPSSR